MSNNTTAFTRGCATIVRLLQLQRHGELDADDEKSLAAALIVVTETLPALMKVETRGLGVERGDVAQEALQRFLTAVNAGKVHPEGSPAGYLLVTAINVARSMARRPPLPIPDLDALDATVADVDRYAELLDQLASEDGVREALGTAATRGDHTTVAVVRAWLDLAHNLGAAPSSRQVATELAISKTSVANALDRFRSYLPSRS